MKKNRNFFMLAAGIGLLFVLSPFLPGVADALGENSPVFLPFLEKQQIAPEPTPTEEPPKGVMVLDNHFAYTTPWDSLHINGEVLNNTSNHLTLVKIIANLFNSQAKLVATEFTYVNLDNLPAGEKTCFDLIFLDVPADWQSYDFEQPTYWTDGKPFPKLTVLNESSRYISTTGSYEILGQVRNDHGAIVKYVQPVGTLYNSSGTVIGCDFTYVQSTDLDDGQVSAFDLSFSSRSYSDAASYRLQVDGWTE